MMVRNESRVGTCRCLPELVDGMISPTKVKHHWVVHIQDYNLMRCRTLGCMLRPQICCIGSLLRPGNLSTTLGIKLFGKLDVMLRITNDFLF